MPTEPAVSAEILSAAKLAAIEATFATIKANPDQWYPCGFAWVTIKPARGPFIAFLKSRGIGDKSYTGGWTIWNPSDHPTQWMDAKFAGAQAFADVLQQHGINAIADQRMD